MPHKTATYLLTIRKIFALIYYLYYAYYLHQALMVALPARLI